MASPLLPPRFWGLDGLMESFPKFYIQDLLEMPEMESHSGIFRYRDHPVSTVDILGVILKVDKRDKIIIYAVDDGTGAINCSCFKNTSSLEEEAISKLKGKLKVNCLVGACVPELMQRPRASNDSGIQDELKGGPIEGKLDEVLTETEQGSTGFSIGQLLHVRGVLQTYRNIREIKAYHYAIVRCPSAETERMLHLPQLYQTVYDQPFALPDRLAREVSSLPQGELDRQKLSHELQLQEEFMKLILADLDEKETQIISEHDLLESVKRTAEAVVNEPLIWKKTLSGLEAAGHLCRHPSNEAEHVVIKYNKQLHRSVTEIISKYMEHHTDSSDPGCHFMHIFDELRKLLLFSLINKPSLWKCLGHLEEQSDIISSTEKHFIVFS